MNLINMLTGKPETKEERIARFEDGVKVYRARARSVPGGFKAKFTKMANALERQIKDLREGKM